MGLSAIWGGRLAGACRRAVAPREMEDDDGPPYLEGGEVKLGWDECALDDCLFSLRLFVCRYCVKIPPLFGFRFSRLLGLVLGNGRATGQ